jgi:hypothetical protein
MLAASFLVASEASAVINAVPPDNARAKVRSPREVADKCTREVADKCKRAERDVRNESFSTDSANLAACISVERASPETRDSRWGGHEEG